MLAGLVLFASGAVMGFFGSRLLDDRGPLALLHGDPRHFAEMALRRMSRELDLTEAQRDNLRVGRHDGVVAVVEKLKGHPLFAHVTLTRSERSPIAALVTEMLEDVSL